jgi:predicted nucleotidyltransferase
MGTELIHRIPWLDPQTTAALTDIIQSVAREHSEVQAAILFGSIARHDERPLGSLQPSDVDLLLLIDPSALGCESTRLDHGQELALTGTIGEADYRHTAPRRIQVLFMYRDLAGWDPAFIDNVARDGVLLWARSALPAPLAPLAARAAGSLEDTNGTRPIAHRS